MSAAFKQGAASFVSGVLFAIGLAISGMTRPAKVIGFLDVAGGRWDPSLMFVMVGAIGTSGLFYALVRRRAHALLGGSFALPSKRTLDAKLIAGAAIFGIGWGLGGYCPGPGVTSIASGSIPAIVFVAAMVASTWVVARAEKAHAPVGDDGAVAAR